MKYIDLTKPHAYLIWKGKQRAIVSPELLPTGEKMLVIQDSKEAFGEVVLGHPSQVNLSEFERLEEEHSIRPEERKLKWPDQKSFYLYRFKDWRPFPDARDITIDNGQAEVLPFVELTEAEQKLLEQAERLPKTLVLKDEAVTLEDGQVIFCEGLDGSKVMPILQATLEDKSVQDSLPLYQLALVRIPRLKLKKNMEDNMDDNDEKAEGTKPYSVMRNQGDCTGHAVIKKADGKVMGCHDSEEEAMVQVAALYAADEEEEKGGPGSGPQTTGSPRKPSKPGGGQTTNTPGSESDEETTAPSTRTSPNRAATTRKPKSKKALAQALVDVLIEDDDISEDDVVEKPLAVFEEGEKEQSLNKKIEAIRNAFHETFIPKPPKSAEMAMYKSHPWVNEIYPDYVVVRNDEKIYKVGYSIDENGVPKFSDKSKWVEMEVQLAPTGNVGAKDIFEGYEEAVKSRAFGEWITDYYELLDNPLLVTEDAVKAVWTAKFVNDLPDSSFLHIVPNCGEKDEDGRTKPRGCRMFPVKDANGEIDLPHLRNAIARAPQASTIPEEVRAKIQKKAQSMLAETKEGEKAGRKVKKTMMEKVRNAWATIKEFIDWAEPEEEDEEEEMMGKFFGGKSSVGIKKVGDKYYYVTWSTNAFQDREKEIFSTKSLEKYVTEAEKKEDRGFFNLWHIPDTDFAKKEWQGVAGRFLIEAGPFLDDAKGKAALKFFKQYSEGHKDLAPEGWGCSPEYRYLPEERKTKVYENVWITRTSTLPKMAAANIWTQGGITMALTQEQQKAAELIFGEELTKEIVQTAEAKTKELEEAGVAHKSVEEEPKTDEKPVEEQKTELTGENLIDQLAEKMGQKMEVDWAPLKGMLEELVNKQKTLESELTNLKTEVSEEAKAEAQKAKEESPRYVWRLFERASEAEKTVVADDDPLKNMKPQEAAKSDKSGAAHFFGK